MIRAAIIAATMLAAWPAAAQSEALLDCVAVEQSVAFRDKVTDAILAPDSPEAQATVEELIRAADGCAQKNGLAEDRWEAYFQYSLARLSHDSLLVRLGTKGISAAALDDIFEYGEGRANPVLKGGLSAEQTEALVAGLSAAGVDVQAIADATWNTIGSYLAATSDMWQARAKLR